MSDTSRAVFLTLVVLLSAMTSGPKALALKASEKYVKPIPLQFIVGAGLYSGPGVGNDTYISKTPVRIDIDHLNLEVPDYGIRLLAASSFPIGFSVGRKFSCCEGDPFKPYGRVGVGAWANESGGLANFVNFHQAQLQLGVGLNSPLNFEFGATSNLKRAGFYLMMGFVF